ncbi:MAG: hypothetical protein AABY26_02075, partial [Nanoarchaeota archaeon]
RNCMNRKNRQPENGIKKNEQNTREWREKQEQVLRTWREAQEEHTKQIREAQEERRTKLRELLTEQTEQLRELNRKQSEEKRALLEKSAQQVEEFQQSGNYAGLERRTKSGAEERKTESEQKIEIKIVKKPKALDAERKTFADTISKDKSYASLLGKPELAGLFSRYSNLKGTEALPAARITTSVTDPKTLDALLEKVNEAIEELPENYTEIMKSTKVKVYVAATTAELSQKCNQKSSGGCYLPEENRICVGADFGLETYKETMIHELSHVVYEKLPTQVKHKLRTVITAIISRPEIKKDVVKDKNGYVVSWKDGLTLPRYSFVKPHGASNANEFIAEYVEDIYSSRSGRKLAVVLRGDYRQDAILALETMKEAGFLGTKEEAYVTIGKVLGLAKK